MTTWQAIWWWIERGGYYLLMTVGAGVLGGGLVSVIWLGAKSLVSGWEADR